MNKEDMIERVRQSLETYMTSRDDEERISSIINAMRAVDRKFFVPRPEQAYIDTALPIGNGQTISQPSTVARVLMLSEVRKGDDCLEIGSGSGWNAALLGVLASPGKVVSLDIIDSLVRQAKSNLEQARRKTAGLKGQLDNVRFMKADIFKEAWEETYDRIIMTAGITEGKQEIVDLAGKFLNDGGILVCPHTEGPLMLIRKQEGKTKLSYTKEEYVFVPLR